MFESLRNQFKSQEDKRQEMINAYLDGALSPKDKARFEDQLAADQNLKRELRQFQWLRQSINQLPRSRAPRNFTLDPALYGKPSARYPVQLYPVLRTATVLAGIIFVFLVGLELISPNQDSSTGLSSIAQLVGDVADVDSAGEALMVQEVLSSEPVELVEEELLPAEAVAEEETVVLEAEIQLEKAATEEASAFRLEQESIEAEIPAEGIAEEAELGPAAPEEPSFQESAPGFSEAEESFEDAATDAESDSALPSASGPLTGDLVITPNLTITTVPTITYSEVLGEEIAGYPAESSQEIDGELVGAASEPASDDALALGGNGSEAASVEPGMDNQSMVAEPAVESIVEDESLVDSQQSNPILRLLVVALGIGLVLLILITLLVRSRAKNYY